MNEYNHISPNVHNYNSNCINIQNLFQEMLNPQKININLKEMKETKDVTIFYKNFHKGYVPREIKKMNPEMNLISVSLIVVDEIRRMDELSEEEDNSRFKLFVETFNKTYPRFFTVIMNSIKNNQVYIPLVEDSGMIRYGNNANFEFQDQQDPDLGLTICDYINLEITQPGEFGNNNEKNIRIHMTFTIYEENLFEFVLMFNFLVVAKKLIRLQSNKNLNIARDVPIQTNLIRVKPDFTAYPDDHVDERQNIQGSKYYDNTKFLIHSTNNTRFVKKNENVSNIPMAFNVEKYKPILNDNDRVFNQLHNNTNRNNQRLPTVKARFQKFVNVTNENKTKKKGGKIRKKKSGKTRKKKMVKEKKRH
jgi:hypothetical protein